MSVFSHSGRYEEVLYHLPIIRHKGGGRLVLFPAACTGHWMTRERAEPLAALIRAQPYIAGVEWRPRPDGLNLDEFRGHCRDHLNLTDMACECFGVPHPPREQPWLFAAPRRLARVVFHRSPRCHNPEFPWQRVYETYRAEAAFVGHPHEHADFCNAVGPVSYLHTADMLELAEVIAGCELFVGNQSAPFAVAEGLKVPTVLEIVPAPNNCHWERRGSVHGWAADVPLPEVAELPERLAGSLAARGSGYSLLTEDRLTALARLVRETVDLPGDMAELGVCRGGSAKVIAAAAPHKTLHLFDTFHGSADAGPVGQFVAGPEAVREYLSGSRVTFNVGPFPATGGNLPATTRFSFVHADTDTFAGTAAATRYFWPRLVPGGIMVFDEYGGSACPGVERAVRETIPEVHVEGGNGQGVARKEQRPPRPVTRTPAFDRALALFRERGGRRVVELGSIRSIANAESDGHSTLAFAAAADEVYSVDKDPGATALTRRLTAGHATVCALTMDGLRFLEAFDEPIDLLYLDGLDADLPGSADWHLAAFRAAGTKLHAGSLVLIDDAPSKGARVVPEAVAEGWQVVFDGSMTLLARPLGGAR